MTARPIRIQLRRTKGWRMPPNTVRVSRPGKWGNPYVIVTDATEAVDLYRSWMEGCLAGIAADPYGARLAFREGFTRDAWEKLTPAQRDAFGNVEQSVWPDEPALSRVDDGAPNWMDRVKATGNCGVTLIPQLIGEALVSSLESEDLARANVRREMERSIA